MKFIDTRNSKQRKDPRKVVAVVRLEHDTAVVIAPFHTPEGKPTITLGDLNQYPLIFQDVQTGAEFFQHLSEEGLTFPLDIELVPIDECSYCHRKRISPDREPTGKTYLCENCKKTKAAERAWRAKNAQN